MHRLQVLQLLFGILHNQNKEAPGRNRLSSNKSAVAASVNGHVLGHNLASVNNHVSGLQCQPVITHSHVITHSQQWSV